MQDPNDRPTAGELLKDPWLVGSQKTLKMSWNKAAGLAHRGLKQREAHRTLASVVQRMIDHSNSDAVSREGVLNDDSAEHYERPSSARNGSGAGAVPSMGMVAGDSRATSTASVGSAAGEGGLLGRKEIVNSMLPPLPPYRDDTAKGRSTLSMMPVEEGQEEGNSAAAVCLQCCQHQLMLFRSGCLQHTTCCKAVPVTRSTGRRLVSYTRSSFALISKLHQL